MADKRHHEMFHTDNRFICLKLPSIHLEIFAATILQAIEQKMQGNVSPSMATQWSCRKNLGIHIKQGRLSASRANCIMWRRYERLHKVWLTGGWYFWARVGGRGSVHDNDTFAQAAKGITNTLGQAESHPHHPLCDNIIPVRGPGSGLGVEGVPMDDDNDNDI